MTTKKRTRNTAGAESEQSAALRKKYLKTMRAAVRYVAAIQDCIQSDPTFSAVRPMHRLFRDIYVQRVCAGGLNAALHIRPERARAVLRRDIDWRPPFLFFFQDNVDFEYRVTEKNRPYKVIVP